MTKRTTLNREYSETGSVLYLAFELSANKWLLGFSIGLGQKPRRRTIDAGNLESLQIEVASAKKRFQLREDACVVSCYEAGRDGFWLDRYLRSAGIDNLVVDSSSIEVNRRQRRAKADGIDVEGLLKLLIRHHLGEDKVWSVVNGPSREDEDRRQSYRELATLRKEKTRTICRIKGLLACQGVRLQGPLDLTDKRLQGIRLWDGSPLLPGLARRLKREWELLCTIKRQIAEVEGERRKELRQNREPDLKMIRQLETLRGISSGSSWPLVREFFGWREFNNARELGSLAGFTPTPYISGDLKVEQGISKAGNRRIRAVCVELAWGWLRHQPNSNLTQWFMTRFAGGGKRARKVGIVAVARRLLIELWRYLKTGAIPEGAELKTARVRA